MSRTRQPEKDSFYMGLRILEYLVAGRTSRGVSQIANALDSPVSSTHDMLKLLVHFGFVSQQSGTHRYEVTTGIFRLMNRFATEFGILPQARDPIKNFTLRAQSTIYLCRWWQGETYVVYAQGPLASTSSLGGHHPARFSAAAKCLLARKDPASWKDAAREPGDDACLQELSRIRKEGVAWNIRQSDPDICSIAIPLGDRDDLEEYALAMVLTPGDFASEDRLLLLKNLRQLRDEIVRRLPAR
jgi:DNA-binding IclR family transcriptional regulator